MFGLKSLRRSKTQVPAVQGDGASQALPALDPNADMGFLDHLEELRWRIIKGLAGVGVAVVVCLIYGEWIIQNVLLGPINETFYTYRLLKIEVTEIILQNRTITGQFFAYWGTMLFVGLIAGIPVVIYQLWAFIEPGLYPNEKSGMRFVSWFATFFFVLGASFGYFVITPIALQFFANFQIADGIVNEFDISKYFDMLALWVLGAGLLFELPVVVYFLSKIRVLTPEIMKKSRRYALVTVLTISAFLTPPDPLSQVLMAIPLGLLYEGSIWISSVVTRREAKKLEKAIA